MAMSISIEELRRIETRLKRGQRSLRDPMACEQYVRHVLPAWSSSATYEKSGEVQEKIDELISRFSRVRFRPRKPSIAL